MKWPELMDAKKRQKKMKEKLLYKSRNAQAATKT